MVGEVHRYDYRTNLLSTSFWMTLLKTVLHMGQLVVVVSAAARFTSLSDVKRAAAETNTTSCQLQPHWPHLGLHN